MIITRPRFAGLVAVLQSGYFIVVTTTVTDPFEFPRFFRRVRKREPFFGVSTPKQAGVIIIIFFPEATTYFVTVTFFVQIPFNGYAILVVVTGVYENTSVRRILTPAQMEGFVALIGIVIANTVAHVDEIFAFFWS